MHPGGTWQTSLTSLNNVGGIDPVDTIDRTHIDHVCAGCISAWPRGSDGGGQTCLHKKNGVPKLHSVTETNILRTSRRGNAITRRGMLHTNNK